MPDQDTSTASTSPTKTRDRRERVRLVHSATVGRAVGEGVRDTAAAEGVPVSALYHLLARAAAIDAPEAETAFFMSPVGFALLHRIHCMHRPIPSTDSEPTRAPIPIHFEHLFRPDLEQFADAVGRALGIGRCAARDRS